MRVVEEAKGKTQVVSVRLNREIVEELKRRGDISTVLKEIISKSITKSTESSLPEIITEFKNRVEEYIERVKQFCNDHANEIITFHESEKDKFEYWRDTCLHRYRTITRHNLHVYVKDKLFPKIRPEDRASIEKQVNKIIEDAVNEIYNSQYPPVYPI